MLTLAAFLATTLFAQSPAADPPIFGFSAAGAAKERALEAQFDSSLKRDELRDWMKRLSARPHHLGSAYDHDNALFIAGLFKSWGYDTTIEEFRVLFPTPKRRVVELIAPERFVAKLAEPPVAGDATSGQTSEQLPTYNAYSIDGDVTGDLVYANYGVPADYEILERNGIDVKGKIVITRYGGSWRGIKPKVAAEHGAIGCIIYSDPRDDGYGQGDVYPKGAYRNENGAQRGSVMDMPVHPGDPLTPGVGATAEAKRIDRKDSDVITKIPVLPISYSDALPLLRALGGPVAPPEWRGALPITYHLGPGPSRVHVALEFNWNLVPAYDVIARMVGSQYPDEWIMRGNHSDAWVNGADDPISGLVAELEEAKAIGELAKSGWRPKRTIQFAAWDGEEEGLIGSTEWAETHADDLRRNGVVYINSDTNARGFLDAGGSHTLERLVTQVARDVPDPERNVSVLARMRAHDATQPRTNMEMKKEEHERELIRLDALGSGSDFTPFLQHTGIAALNIGYGGEGGGGSYHSVYDSFDHYTRFLDPTFDYGIAQAKTTGRLVLRLANADVLPFELSTFAETMSRYLDELTKLSETMRQNIEEKNRLVREHAYEIAADPTKPFVGPKAEEPVPYLNFAPLQNAVAHLKQSTREFDRAVAALPADAAVRQAAADQALMHIEQSLLRADGLPKRPWFRHQIYAPGFYTGYGVKTVPGVREAIEQKDWTEANRQIELAASVINRYVAETEKNLTTVRGK
ncbi:MAG: N-acetylated-alpha-linked acidic dipeptidase [Thermoanaerobaculia bacterium]|jgi:N-acetylated-alpha-linked acidic dipeptidase|nr:N-acetylated-alpha-linked acidic dipeptidase [Thermoanaerobaculia bacterium]